MQRLVLVGGGHAHLFVLKALARQQKAIEVILLTPQTHQTYSAMIPGWISGHYKLKQCLIDLQPLAKMANAEIMLHKAVQMNAMQHQITLENGQVLDYDWLSLDIGSESNLAKLDAYQQPMIPIRPITHFIEAWESTLQLAQTQDNFSLAVAGGGAAGVELAFAIKEAFRQHKLKAQVSLLVSEQGILPEHPKPLIKRTENQLKKYGIQVYESPDPAVADGVPISNGEVLHFDRLVAATGACAPRWLRSSFLALDQAGYIKVDEHHRSRSHYNVFAAGDVCSREHASLERNGAHAVQAGTALAQNLLNAISGEEDWEDFNPKASSMALITAGRKYAFLSKGDYHFQGKWVWYLKDFIDRRFVKSHH